jgi:hypothetical protein
VLHPCQTSQVLAALHTAEDTGAGNLGAVDQAEQEDRDLLRVLSLLAPLMDLPLPLELFTSIT